MLDTNDILDTIRMISDENLDVRTVTMGISLLDCADADGRRACEKIYNKITSRAKDLVRTAEHISATYGMPIVNKRVSVTPIAMLLAGAPDADPVWYARALDAAARAVGVNFIGGYSALVHKGFSAGDERLIRSIPDALAQTDFVCSSAYTMGGTAASCTRMPSQAELKAPATKAAMPNAPPDAAIRRNITQPHTARPSSMLSTSEAYSAPHFLPAPPVSLAENKR